MIHTTGKSACTQRNRIDCLSLGDYCKEVFRYLVFGPGPSCRTHAADSLVFHCSDSHSKLSHLCQVGIQIACTSSSTSRCASNGEGRAKEEQAGVLEDKAARQPEISRTAAAASGVNVAEWDRLEGRDLFRKFSSLLAERYPL